MQHDLLVRWHWKMHQWLLENIGQQDHRWTSETWRTDGEYNTMMGFRYIKDEVLFVMVWGDHCKSLRRVSGVFDQQHFEYFFQRYSAHPWILEIDHMAHNDVVRWRACHDQLPARLDSTKWFYDYDTYLYRFANQEDRDRVHHELTELGLVCKLEEFDPEWFWTEAEYLKNN